MSVITDLTTHVAGYACAETTGELQSALEGFLAGKLSAAALDQAGRAIRLRRWQAQQRAGLSFVAVNDFTLGDAMLDLACTFGLMPARFAPAGAPVTLERYFQMSCGRCRDTRLAGTPLAKSACPPTGEIFSIPELPASSDFHLAWPKILDETREALLAGFRPKPVLMGPVTFLNRCQLAAAEMSLHLEKLIPVYCEVLHLLHDAGAEWVEIQEPVLAGEKSGSFSDLVRIAAEAFSSIPARPQIMLSIPAKTAAAIDWPSLAELPFDGFHLAVTDAPQLPAFPEDKVVSVGVVDGSSLHRTDVSALHSRAQKLRTTRNGAPLWIGASTGLHHVPALPAAAVHDPEMRSWLSGPADKLAEIAAIASANRPLDACAASREGLRLRRRRALAGALA